MASSAELGSPARVAPFTIFRARFTILRARQWAHFLALPLAGFDPAAGWHRLALGCALAALALAYAYGLNAISDRATDLDPRKNPLVGHPALPRTAAALVIGCGAAALALASTSGALVTAAVAVSLIASTTYSVGPRWKAVPAAGTLLNAAIFAPLLLFSAVGGGPARGLAAQLAAFTALLLQNQLLHEEADAAEDAAAGTRSTAIALGPTRLRVAAAALGIAGAALAALASPSRASTAAALTALLAGTAVAVRDRRPAALRRVVHRWVAFAGGALLFAATRLG